MRNAPPLIAALLLASATLLGQTEPVDTLLQRGDQERMRGQYAAALDTYGLARDRAEAAGDRARVAAAWNGLGVTYRIQSDYPRALDALDRALAIREQLGNRSDIAASLTNLGSLYRQQGRFADAIANHRRALTLLDGEDNRLRRANTLNNLGVAYVAQGDFEEALAFYQQSLALHQSLGNTAGVAGTLGNMGIVYARRGNYGEALRHYERGLALGREVGDRRLIVDSLQTIGVLHSAQGNTTLAMELYRQALAGYTELGVKAEMARMQNNIGSLQARLGQHDRAEAPLQEGLRLMEEIADRQGIAESLRSLAALARRQGNLDLAERRYADSLQRYETIGDQRGVARALAGLQQVLMQSGRHERAVAVGERAVELCRKIGDRDQLWQALTAMGRAALAQGQVGRARDAFTDAVATIETLRLDVAGGEADQQRAFERRVAPYHELLSLLLKDGDTADAFRLAEQAKARVVLDILRSGHVSITAAMSDAEKAEERAANRALVVLDAQIAAERRRAQPDAARLAALEADVGRARLVRDSLETRLYALHPDLKIQRSEAEPVTTDAAAQALPDGASAALEYVVTDHEVWLFVLLRDGTPDAGSARLTARMLTIGPDELAKTVERLATQLAERDVQFRSTATALYDALLAPVETQLAGRSMLVIVPDGVLWQVPFQALWNSRTSEYVVASRAIAYAPSLTVLSETKGRRAASTARSPRLLAFGNPALPALAGRSAADARDASHADLPAAAAEVATLGRLYGTTRSRVYIGADAREDRLKAEAADYSILHIASHGILDDASPMYSRVLLAPSPNTSGDDGELHAWEIARLRLGARLVVLSGCETARGRVAPGEGVIGLTWSLFVAGTSTAVVSQWSVDSATTSDLMLAFHRNLTGGAGGRSPRLSAARALQQAAIPLLRSSRSRHPFYWAAFVVVGDGF